MLRYGSTIVVLLVALIASANEASLYRAPYIQTATLDSARIIWRTDSAVDSWLSYGESMGNQDTIIEDPALSWRHEILIEGLQAGSCYYYSVGTSLGVLAGNDAGHRFCTQTSDQNSNFRVWVLGDSGTGTANAEAVRDAFLDFNNNQPPDVWLMLGDNAYPSGTQGQFQNAVFDMYPTILQGSALWPALGNHDILSVDVVNETGPYYDIFSLPMAGEAGGVASGTEAYYSFDQGSVHFVCLDSASFVEPAMEMLDWLSEDLTANEFWWTIVFVHHSPYTKGSHDSDLQGDSEGRLFRMREIVVPILEDFGVDLVLCGHSHSYERSYLIDAHYGMSESFDQSHMRDGGDGSIVGDGAYHKGDGPHSGAVFIVAGSSGQTSGGSLDHPVMHTSYNELGSLIIDVVGQQSIDISFLDAGVQGVGSQVLDSFRLVKVPGLVFSDGFELGATINWSDEY